MKKGFTLIELLAVIIILGVIIIIVLPSVDKLIKDSKINSFLVASRGLLRSAEISVSSDKLDGIKTETIDASELKYKGDRYNDAEVVVDKKGNIAVAIWNEKLEVCATKGYTDRSVNIDKRVLNKYECVIPGSALAYCSGKRTTAINYGTGIEVYVDKNTLCLFGNENKMPPREVTEPWGELAIELTKFIYDEYGFDDSGEFELEDLLDDGNLLPLAYIAYFLPDGMEIIRESNYEVMNPIFEDFYENTISEYSLYEDYPEFEDFFNSLPYKDPNLAGKIINFKPGENADFYRTIGKVIIAGNITRIGNNAFDTCSLNDEGEVGLYYKRQDKPDFNNYLKYDNAVSNFNNVLVRPLDPDLVINEISLLAPLTEIGAGSFSCNNIEELIIPNSVTTIGSGAFYENDIEVIDLPSSLKRIGTSAFNDNRLEEVIMHEGIKYIGDRSFSYNNLDFVNIPNTVVYLSGFNNNSLQGISIPNGVKILGNEAFEYNNISSITLPSNLKIIMDDAFKNNGIAGTVNIPDGVTTIESYAFRENYIEEVNIPSSVNNIVSDSFSLNPYLSTINADFAYNGLANYPWGSTATINWLGAISRELTYSDEFISISNSCAAGTRFYSGCNILIIPKPGRELVSYNLNGVPQTNPTFIMPEVDSIISDIVTAEITLYILETPHNYAANLSNKLYTVTVPGATKIKIKFNSLFRFESASYDWMFMRDQFGNRVGTTDKYSGTTLANAEFIVNGNRIDVYVRTDGSGQYYGFRMEVTKYQ